MEGDARDPAGFAALPRAQHGAAALATLLAAAALQLGCLAHHAGPMPGEPEAEGRGAQYARIDGTRIRYVDEGEGPAVVLLHGFASSLEVWSGVRPVLRKRHRVVALDLKGFGWSGRPEGDYGPRAQAELVLSLLDRLGVEDVAVVGHSWGASVALATALEAPERVQRVALYDAFVYDDQLGPFLQWAQVDGFGEMLFSLYYDQRVGDRLARAFHDPALPRAAFVDRVERALERPGTRAAALATVRGMRYRRLAERYPEVSQPVLLLWGREDTVAPVAFGERLLRQLPRAEMEIYPRCGHLPMVEAAHASTRDLAAFLAPGQGRARR